MKYAISVQQDNEQTLMDRRFGRCPFFYIYDSDQNAGQFVENPGALLDHGAGLKSAQFVADHGVAQVVTGEVGPKSKEILDKVRIPFILESEEMSLSSILTEITK